MQGAADMSQVTVAVAIGLFGILAIFVTIKTMLGVGVFDDGWWWTKDLWRLATAVTLSAAYLGLVLLGLVCYLWRRQFEAIFDEYLDIGYTKYQKDLRRVSKANWLTNTMIRIGSAPETAEKRRYNGIWIISISYLVISLSLLVVVGIY